LANRFDTVAKSDDPIREHWRMGNTDTRSMNMTFLTHCTVCGRGALVAIEHLGQRIACPHCGASFPAKAASEDEYRKSAQPHYRIRRGKLDVHSQRA
jgi:predicted RNA-binding Zn-ribbon protein involved in translation (DUF1610 family)